MLQRRLSCVVAVVTSAGQVNKMLRWRLSDEPVTEQEKDVDGKVDHEARKQVRRAADVQCNCSVVVVMVCTQVKCTIFLGYTSNIISRWRGMRDV